MNTTPNKLTQDFLNQVQSLIDKGIAANKTEVVNAINWNKSSMSEVSNGRKNVPVAVYRKFVSYYNIQPPEPEQVVTEPEPAFLTSKDEMIALLKQNNKLLEDQLNSATGELRHIAVMNFSMLRAMRTTMAEILSRVAKTEYQQVTSKINKETASYYRKVREKGSLIDLGI